ncbi:phospholipase-like protein 4 [Elsinoe australis]|uniref:Putative phospholipase n=1 Tax=Elsinoe australis TaxID=40998 RepID=A0A4U7AP14_9PEZI|nr:phospholipase-like protein 4 [Elsinoe australis]
MSFLSRFSPVPSFPPLPGPYHVGTVDVEIDVKELESSVPQPEDAPATIAYRIFYPCEKPKDHHARPVYWIPSPQKENLASLIKFGGISDRMAGFLAAFPTPVSHIHIPATRSAPLLGPQTTTNRYPVTIFSHGLAGTRNLYSHLCASLSSYGQIVIAPSHRDGSAPIAHVRATSSTTAQKVSNISIPYSGDDDVFSARDRQLRIRCWEVGLAYSSLLAIDSGAAITNLDENFNSKKQKEEVLSRFKGTFDLRPGAVTFAGHSFGGVTSIQFVKSVYYASSLPAEGTLFRPREGSSIIEQITKGTKLVLFDPWMIPVFSPFQTALKEKPLPCFDGPDAPGGKAVIAIVSEGFWKWKQNLNEVVAMMRVPSGGKGLEPGRAWYAVGSKHFSQSDFGVLFSWLLERFMKAANGRELLEGNVKLVNGMLRENGVEIAMDEGIKREEKVEGAANGMANGSANGVDGGQVEQPVSQAMPNMLDEKVWIKIPVD